ncbi:MAG: hypothetical protein ABI609_06605 [Acidobacteriota bacterium]
MELPTDVLIHCELLGMKGARGRLLQVAAEGYYELNCQFGDRLHRVLLPVVNTVLIQSQPEAAWSGEQDIER